MKTLVRILIIDDDTAFVKRLRDLVNHPQVVVDIAKEVPENIIYNFYILGGSIEIAEAIDKIKTNNEGSPIYLSGSICNKDVPVRKMLRCNIIDCLESDESMRSFAKKVSSFYKQQIRLSKAVIKLERLAAGDLETLARQIKQTESDRFVDYIQNHLLPMVLVSREGEILHANIAMEEIIGIKLPGTPAIMYWDDSKEFDRTILDLNKKGQLLGKEVTLKNIHGERLRVKLYSSLHTDTEGNWLNTRCLFVPICPE